LDEPGTVLSKSKQGFVEGNKLKNFTNMLSLDKINEPEHNIEEGCENNFTYKPE
jgi:hypothetical protein